MKNAKANLKPTTTSKPASSASRSVTVPRVGDTANFAKFQLEKGEAGGPFGSFYLPLAEAGERKAVTVTY